MSGGVAEDPTSGPGLYAITFLYEVCNNGDDFNDFDDEDGVTISALIAGATATVDATEGTGSNGFVSAWIDFDGNGTFDDPAERIIDNGFVPGGTTETFTFTVPASAVADSTYARFRIVTETTGPGPTGLWPNGEVEDYAVTIGAAPPTGTIIDDGDPGFTSSNDWDPRRLSIHRSAEHQH